MTGELPYVQRLAWIFAWVLVGLLIAFAACAVMLVAGSFLAALAHL